MAEKEYKDPDVLTIAFGNKGKTVLLLNFHSLEEQPHPPHINHSYGKTLQHLQRQDEKVVQKEP